MIPVTQFYLAKKSEASYSKICMPIRVIILSSSSAVEIRVLFLNTQGLQYKQICYFTTCKLCPVAITYLMLNAIKFKID